MRKAVQQYLIRILNERRILVERGPIWDSTLVFKVIYLCLMEWLDTTHISVGQINDP